MTYAIGPDMWAPRNDAAALSHRFGRPSGAAASCATRAVRDFADCVVCAGVARNGVLLVGEDGVSAAGNNAAMPRVAGRTALAKDAGKKGFGAMLARACAAMRNFLNAPMW